MAHTRQSDGETACDAADAQREVALWFNGSIVWSGSVGARVCDIAFDAVSMHVDDGNRMLATVGDQPTAEHVLSVLAGWWD